MKIIDHRRPQAVPLREVPPGIGEGKGFRLPGNAGQIWYAMMATGPNATTVETVSEGGLIRFRSLDIRVHPVGGSEPAKVRFGDLEDGAWFMTDAGVLGCRDAGERGLSGCRGAVLMLTNGGVGGIGYARRTGSEQTPDTLVTPIPSDKIEIHLGTPAGGQEKIAVDSVTELAKALLLVIAEEEAGDDALSISQVKAVIRKHVVEATASSQPGPTITVDPRTDSATITTGHPWNAEQLEMVRAAKAKAKPQAVAEPSLAALREELAAARAVLRAVLTMKDTEDWVKRFSGIYSFFAKYPDKATASSQEET